jgi:PIN domain nuclease of toxin-antitoxin system
VCSFGLQLQIDLRICDRPFSNRAETALFETRTRDPFDLTIVSHAKATNYSPLVTADEKIRAHYPKAIW